MCAIIIIVFVRFGFYAHCMVIVQSPTGCDTFRQTENDDNKSISFGITIVVNLLKRSPLNLYDFVQLRIAIYSAIKAISWWTHFTMNWNEMNFATNCNYQLQFRMRNTLTTNFTSSWNVVKCLSIAVRLMPWCKIANNYEISIFDSLVWLLFMSFTIQPGNWRVSALLNSDTAESFSVRIHFTEFLL